MPIPRITIADVDRARKTYESNEPRDLFYKAATELVSLAIGGQTSLTLSDAIAVLLQTWNREYYRFRKFDTQHYTDIDNLLSSNRSSLLICRSKKIQDLEEADSNSITGVFVFFEKVLGPVGAAKCLHLLAPNYFPLWDRAIAKVYVGVLGRTGTTGNQYWQMMVYAASQARSLIAAGYTGNPLKAIDEYNYCRFSKKWTNF